MLTIDELLKTAVQKRASDLHLTVGLPPQLRVDGILIPVSQSPLSEEESRGLAFQMLPPDQIARFEKAKELDTSYSVKGMSRFRVNLFYQRGSIATRSLR